MSCYYELGMCLPPPPDRKGVSWVYPPMDKSRPPSLGLMARWDSCTEGQQEPDTLQRLVAITPAGRPCVIRSLLQKRSPQLISSGNWVGEPQMLSKIPGSQVYCPSCLAAPTIPQSVSFYNPEKWVFLLSPFNRQKVIPLQVSYLIGSPIRTEPQVGLQSLGF